MTQIPRRLPLVLTRADLAVLLSPTYAREAAVNEELAEERLSRALKNAMILDRIYDAVSTALNSVQGSRTEDALMDQVSKAVAKQLGQPKAAPTTAALSAVTVWLNIELGIAPADLRATLESDKGRKLLSDGFGALGKHLVKQLVG